MTIDSRTLYRWRDEVENARKMVKSDRLADALRQVVEEMTEAYHEALRRELEEEP